jgi:formate hydrogenlyase transcriptional activator
MREVTQRRRAMQTLRAVTEGTAGVTGSEFFRSLVRNLAQALQMRYSFIAECIDETKAQVRTLALWNGEGFGDEISFPLLGTPCEIVIGGKDCFYPERLQQLFPADAALVKLNAQSYIGVPVLNSNGQILGHVVVMDDKPREELEQYIPLLRTFGARAGAELERKRAEDALRLSEKRRRALLDINNAIVTKLAHDELWMAIADALGQVLSFDRVALSLYDADAGSLRIASHAGPYERADYTPVGRVLDLRDSPAGEAFAQRRPIIRRDLEVEQPTASDRRAYSHGFRSLCALPLVVRGDCIGTITVGSLKKFSYSEADSGFLLELANQIAIAVDNMRIHEEAEALRARFQAEAVYLQEEIKTEHNFEAIIGQSAPVRELLRKVEQVAPTDATVLIRGETGTGKELLARAVHDRSRRKDRPLVKVNCGSIPSGLVESELFGHEKGAFTGATQRRIGRFELAHGGTIFLDEVTELPLDTQVKLLRVLQEGEFERVGSSQTMKVDVRVIAATNRDLSEIVAKGIFRSDLYYRLNVFPIESPALRERKDDIPLLVSFFLSRFGKKLGREVRGVAQKSMECLIHYNWPGNVRELQNVIERAVVLARGPVVQVDESMLRSDLGAADASPIETLASHERNHIIRALNETNWVIHGKNGAAEMLGINPSTLRSRMEKLGIKKR